jgi:hypothetical protein
MTTLHVEVCSITAAIAACANVGEEPPAVNQTDRISRVQIQGNEILKIVRNALMGQSLHIEWKQPLSM